MARGMKRKGGKGQFKKRRKKKPRDEIVLQDAKKRAISRGPAIVPTAPMESSSEDETQEDSSYNRLLLTLRANSKHEDVHRARQASESECSSAQEEEEEDCTVLESESNEYEQQGDMDVVETGERDSASDDDADDFNSQTGNEQEDEESEDGEALSDEEIDVGHADSFTQHFQAAEFTEEDAAATKLPRQWNVCELPLTSSDAPKSSGGQPVMDVLFAKGRVAHLPTAFPARLDSIGLPAKLLSRWRDVHELPAELPTLKKKKGQTDSRCPSDLCHSVQHALYPSMASYLDVMFTGRTVENSSALREMYCLHALSHITKTRRRVLKNNERLRAAVAAGKSEPEDVQDQGYTRPRVLILVPFRNSAKKIVDSLLQLSPEDLTASVLNRERFEEEYGVAPDEEEEIQQRMAHKPLDYAECFSGNVDDCFSIGICFSRKSVRLCAPFANADIIVASPLGLALTVSDAGDKRQEFDFLSSIEIMVVDQADAILMQNFDHVTTVVEATNRVPRKALQTDFRRVREWALDGHAQHLRQTIVFSAFPSPDLNAQFLRGCTNAWGAVRSVETYSGVLESIGAPARQVFQRLPDSCDLTEADDARFDYFTTKLLQRIVAVNQQHTLVFVRSYMDFVRIRNFSRGEEMGFGFCSEYSKPGDISRTRSRFFHGDRNMILYTERFHFFKRLKFRGVQHIVFYQLPDHADFYAELVNLVTDMVGGGCTVTVLYDKFDKMQLQRVVGSQRASRMMTSDKTIHLFC